MTVISWRPLALAALPSAVGLVTCWATGTPFGLLAPFAVLLRYAPAGLLRSGSAALALAAAAAAVSLAGQTLDDDLAVWAGVVAIALALAGTLGTTIPARRRQVAGAPAYAVTSLDVDAYRRTVDALRDRERELSQLVDLVPSHVWRLTPDGEPAFFNKRMADFLGLDVADLATAGATPLAALTERTVHPDDAAAFSVALGLCLRSGAPFALRYRLRRSDGAYRWMSSRAEPVRDDAGAVVQWYGICHDIDDQVHAEDRLRRSQRELQQLIDTVPVQIWCVTAEGQPAYVNKTMADFTGMPLQAFDPDGGLPGAIDTLVHPDDRGPLGAALSHSFRTGEPFHLRFRNRRRDGVFRWQEGRAEPLRDECGAIVRWYGANVDIDDQVRLYDDLAEREARIRRLVDSDVIGIVIWDLDGTLVDANDAFLRTVGYGRDDVRAGLRWFDMTPPDWQEVHAHEEAEELAATGKMQAREKEYFRKDGTRVPVLIGAACFEGRSRQGVAYILDLTDHKRAEAELRASKQQLEQMIDALPINILSFDPHRRLTYASKRYLDTVGLPPAEIKDFEALARDVAHPDDFEAMFRKASRGFATGEAFVNRFRRRCGDGVHRWIEARAQALRDQGDAIVQWYVVSIDIEEEMQAQEALRERERFLWQLVETLPAMIDCAAPDGEPVYRSQQLRQYLGYDLEALDGAGRSRLSGTLEGGVHPDDLAGVLEDYGRSLATGAPYQRRHRLRRFDGTYRWVETRAAPMRQADGTIVQWNVICLDIDGEVQAQQALRLAQERVAQAAQAASLAELSASIAHEVNQPLAAVVANSHACQRWLIADPPNLERARRTVERITRDANAAAQIVGRIRALFRQSAELRTSTTFDAVIAEARSLLADEAARRGVRVEVDVAAGLPPVAIDRVQIQQVLVNLVRNAMEAMDDAADKSIRITIRRDGDAIRTAVADRGPGVAEPDRIFAPFFTTKPHGMGMGLAICRSVVEAHGGQLWAEAGEPTGATFVFTLPVGAVPA